MDTMLLLVALPLVLIQLALIIYNVRNLNKIAETKYLNKTIWLLIIIFGNLLGNICFMLLEGNNNDRNQAY